MTKDNSKVVWIRLIKSLLDFEKIFFIVVKSVLHKIYHKGDGNGNPLQYSCLGNPTDRRAWQAILHGVSRVRHDIVTKTPKLFIPISAP